MNEASRLVTVEQLAEVLNLPQNSVRRQVRLGKLPAIHIGRLLRFDIAEVDAALRAGQEGDEGTTGGGR